jgi:hypothetical protein
MNERKELINKLIRSDEVELVAEELEEILTPSEADSNSLDSHSAPTLILTPPQSED